MQLHLVDARRQVDWGRSAESVDKCFPPRIGDPRCDAVRQGRWLAGQSASVVVQPFFTVSGSSIGERKNTIFNIQPK